MRRGAQRPSAGLRRRAGMSLIELMVVLAIVAVVVGLGAFSLDSTFADQRVKGAARDVADAFMLARAEAIRSGNNHLVVFSNALGASAPIVVVDDGDADCAIDSDEVKHFWPAVDDVSWGTSAGLANGTAAPDDAGNASGSIASTGSSFVNADSPGAPATWVLFQPDGFPRPFTSGSCDIGRIGMGGGAIYVTNGRRDYAVVLAQLGSVRVHAWGEGMTAWRK